MKLKLLLILMLMSSSISIAAPINGTVVEGSATIVDPLNITQDSPHAIITWDSFNIAAGDTFTVNQTDSSYVLLNKVLGVDSTNISGTISALGSVWILNPNGIVIGPTAIIDTHGFIASTLDITNEDFMDGDSVYNFTGASTATVQLEGNIVTKGVGGYVMLAGSNVVHNGYIASRIGTVGLVAGSAVTISFHQDGLINFSNLEHADAVTITGGIVDVSYKIVTPNADVTQFINTSNSATPASGVTKAGDILIFGGSATISGNAKIYSKSVVLEGSGGNININTDGNITITNSFQTAMLSASSSIFNYTLSVDEIANAGNISLISENGNIALDNSNLDVSASYSGGFIGMTGLNTGNAGDLTLSAGGDISLNNSKLIASGYSMTPNGYHGNGGDISLTAGNYLNFNYSNNYTINIDTKANRGEGGGITFNANNDITISNGYFTTVSGLKKSGDISIESASGSISLDAQIYAYSDDFVAGDIYINAAQDIIGDGSHFEFYNFSESGVTGDAGGDVTLIAGNNIDISANVDIESYTCYGAGNGGNISFNAGNDIIGSGSYYFYLDASGPSSGDVNSHAGNIELIAERDIKIKNLDLYTNIRGDGSAGNVTIDAGRDFESYGSYSYIDAYNRGLVGSKAGDISITAGNLITVNDGYFGTDSIYGDGNSGNVLISANSHVSLTEMEINTKSNESIGGNITIISNFGNILLNNNEYEASSELNKGGNILFNAGEDIISTGVYFWLDNYSEGNDGGNVELMAGNNIDLSAAVEINSYANNGNGGNISFKAGNDILNTTRYLVLDVSGNGDINSYAGNLELVAGNDIKIKDLDLYANNLGDGSGGNVMINAGNAIELYGGYSNIDVVGASESKSAGINISAIGDVTINAEYGEFNLGDIGSIEITGLNKIYLASDINMDAKIMKLISNKSLELYNTFSIDEIHFDARTIDQSLNLNLSKDMLLVGNPAKGTILLGSPLLNLSGDVSNRLTIIDIRPVVSIQGANIDQYFMTNNPIFKIHPGLLYDNLDAVVIDINGPIAAQDEPIMLLE